MLKPLEMYRRCLYRVCHRLCRALCQGLWQQSLRQGSWLITCDMRKQVATQQTETEMYPTIAAIKVDTRLASLYLTSPCLESLCLESLC